MYILDETTEKDSFVGDCPKCGNSLIISSRKKTIFECTHCNYKAYNYNFYKTSTEIHKENPFNYGKACYEKHKYEIAFDCFKAVAEKGNLNAIIISEICTTKEKALNKTFMKL